MTLKNKNCTQFKISFVVFKFIRALNDAINNNVTAILPIFFFFTFKYAFSFLSFYLIIYDKSRASDQSFKVNIWQNLWAFSFSLVWILFFYFFSFLIPFNQCDSMMENFQHIENGHYKRITTTTTNNNDDVNVILYISWLTVGEPFFHCRPLAKALRQYCMNFVFIS